MAVVRGSVQYDQITSQELFDSFMDIVLTHGDDDNNGQIQLQTTNNGFDELHHKVGNKLPAVGLNTHIDKSSKSAYIEEGSKPYPLLVKMGEPIYESCGDGVNGNPEKKITSEIASNAEKTNSAVEASYAVVDKNRIGCPQHSEVHVLREVKVDIKSNVVTEIPMARTNVETGLENNSSVNKASNPNEVDNNEQLMSQTKSSTVNEDGNYDEVEIPKYNPASSNQNIADLYAVVDKHKQTDKIIYADVNSVITNNPSVSMQPSNSQYTEVVIADSQTVSDYESISELMQLSNLDKNKPADTTAKETVYNAEEIAYSGKRLHTVGQNEMFSDIASTIDRGNTQLSPRSVSTSAKEKRGFFDFGHKKHNSEDYGLDSSHHLSMQRWSAVPEFNYTDGKTEKRPSKIKRQSSIPILCSGYLFKQGGTGMTPKNWRLRWFELKKDNCLYYYKNEQDPIPNGAVMLLKYAVARAAEVNKRFAFKLIKGGARTYFFAANSEEEMRKWMKNLSEASRYAVSDHTSIPECSLKNVSIPALSITEPDCHGFLWKQGDSHKSWKKRYCVLKYGCVFYYEDMSNEVAIGVFKLHNYTISQSKHVKYGFEAEPPVRKMRTYHFYADSEIDFKRWFQAVKHSVATFK